MNEKLEAAVQGLKDRYELGEMEFKAVKLAVTYTVEAINELIELVEEMNLPTSNKSWTIPRCEIFCENFGLSMEVQAFLEEMCLWMMYNVYEYKLNMLYNAKSILKELKSKPKI